MKAICAAALLIAATPASAMVGATVTPTELAAAINRADSTLVPYRENPLLAKDIKSVRCVGPDEEPTEFRCWWSQRTGRGWVKRRTWLAIDGKGWHVMDQ